MTYPHDPGGGKPERRGVSAIAIGAVSGIAMSFIGATVLAALVVWIKWLIYFAEMVMP